MKFTVFIFWNLKEFLIGVNYGLNCVWNYYYFIHEINLLMNLKLHKLYYIWFMTQIKIKNIRVEYFYVISNLMHKYFIFFIYYICIGYDNKITFWNFNMQGIRNQHVYNYVLTLFVTNWRCGGLVKYLVYTHENKGLIPSCE